MVREFQIPTELMDQICSHFIEDKPTSSACTLLSSRWHPSARRALFHTISLSLASDTFDVFFVAPPPKTAQYVKDLTLKCGSLTAHDLDQVISIFPALQRLTLDGTTLYLLDSDHPSIEGWKSPRDLHRLRLTDVTYYMEDWSSKIPEDDNEFNHWLPKPTEDFERFKQEPSRCSLVQLLNLFGNVDTIHIYQVHPVGQGDRDYHYLSNGRWPVDYSWYYRPVFRSAVWAEAQKLLEHFSVKRILAADRGLHNADAWYFEDIVLYLLAYSQKAAAYLDCLEIAEEWTVTSELLNKVGATITHLHLHMDDVMDSNLPNGNFFDWAEAGTVEEAWADCQALFNDILRILRMASATIRHLSFHFETYFRSLTQYDWESLDQLLSSCFRLTDLSFRIMLFRSKHSALDLDVAKSLNPRVLEREVCDMLPLMRTALGDSMRLSLTFEGETA
ncbi:hypothetical protein BXZ70DRAFT_1006730 [Cristinia sonorae]|uniref:Uncharacterized protein n=1 Tax=Cristinia sonorae TaxID=1940300 RepID=A0A8K0UQY9_9AGAR|nr:hypothetical protein BXZ70DRAFT_1006730 [Cristinia sonorae]